MKKLTKQQFDQWLKDLRSGKFKQGRGSLRSRDKYCCLGVCGYRLDDYDDNYLNMNALLSDLSNAELGAYIDKRVQIALYLLNDALVWTGEEVFNGFTDNERAKEILISGGSTFADIADKIEKLQNEGLYEFYETNKESVPTMVD